MVLTNGPPPPNPAPPRAMAAQAVRLMIAELKRTFRRQVSSNPAKLGVLADSIRRDGQLAPIHVSADFDVIDGNNRVAALESLGRTEVLAVVHDDIVTPEQKAAAFVAMEAGKSSRSVHDVAFPLDALRRELGLTWAQAAEAFRVSPASASRFKRVTEAPEDVLAALRDGRITLTELVEVMRVEDARRPELLAAAVAGTDAKGLRALARAKRGGRRKPVAMQVGDVLVTAPAHMPPAAVIELLRTKLFAALSRAGALGLGVESAPKILQGLGR